MFLSAPDSLRTTLDVARGLTNALPRRQRALTATQLAAGYCAETDSAAYARSTFAQHAAATGARGRVLEIGPGGNTAVAALFVREGADKAVCIDSTPWLKEKDALYRELGVSEILGNVDYLSPVTLEQCELPAASFDVIFSHATLEHVSDPARAVANIGRMLRPGGVTSHQIDLRDHRDFTKPLAFLRHGDRVWNVMKQAMTMPPNRLRGSDWCDLFERNGLAVRSLRPTITTIVSEEERAQFARRFRTKTLDDLRVVSVHLVATKPRASKQDPSNLPNLCDEPAIP